MQNQKFQLDSASNMNDTIVVVMPELNIKPESNQKITFIHNYPQSYKDQYYLYNNDQELIEQKYNDIRVLQIIFAIIMCIIFIVLALYYFEISIH
jgi:uncharacterized membrane protein YagU involved in acid resistance